MLPFYHFLLFFHNRWTVFCAIFSYFLLSYFGRVLDMTQSHWEQKLIRKGDNMCGPPTIYMEVGIGFESIYLKHNLQPASLKKCKSEQHTEVGLSHKRLWPYQWMALGAAGRYSFYLRCQPFILPLVLHWYFCPTKDSGHISEWYLRYLWLYQGPVLARMCGPST